VTQTDFGAKGFCDLPDGQDADSLGLDGTESFSIPTLDDSVKALQSIEVIAQKTDGSRVQFTTTVRLDTPVEVEYYKNGGILHTVVRNMARA
jgi:aconitate hydratase